MITEPEMEEPGAVGPADVLSDDDQRPSSGGGLAKRRPWIWAGGGVVAASLVWVAALQGTGYGQTKAPDLHGYHLGGSLCTTSNLQPIVDALTVSGYTADNHAPTHKGPTMDHSTCAMTGSTSTGDGWSSTYTIAVTVDLHKKTDPSAEFEDLAGLDNPGPTPAVMGDFIYLPDTGAVVQPFPGLGDKAYFTIGNSYQALHVLHGGAIITLSVVAANEWLGTGQPTDANGSPRRPALVDVKPLHPVLPQAMRRLMGVLSS